MGTPTWAKVLIASQGLIILTVLLLFLGIHRNQINGCIRGAQDRQDNALGWETARMARSATARKTMAQTPGTLKAKREAARDDLRASYHYAHIVRSLEGRTRPTAPARKAYCHDQYPIVG